MFYAYWQTLLNTHRRWDVHTAHSDFSLCSTYCGSFFLEYRSHRELPFTDLCVSLANLFFYWTTAFNEKSLHWRDRKGKCTSFNTLLWKHGCWFHVCMWHCPGVFKAAQIPLISRGFNDIKGRGGKMRANITLTQWDHRIMAVISIEMRLLFWRKSLWSQKNPVPRCLSLLWSVKGFCWTLKRFKVLKL